MKTVELLPKGKFNLLGFDERGNSIRYTGRFSLIAIDEFFTEMGINSHIAMIDRMSVGMSLKEYAVLVKAGLNHAKSEAQKLDTNQTMDIIDNVFDGVESDDFKSLIFHGIRRIVHIPDSVNNEISEVAKAEEAAHGE